jgi:Skp family chaperone for outer membrane proteins
MKKLLALFVLTLALVQFVHAESLGFIDVQKVFLGYKEAQKLSEQFEEKQRDFKKDYDVKEAEVMKAIREGKSQAEIDKMKENIKSELEPKQKQLQDFNERSTLKIREEIVKATKDVAKDVGLTMVLDQKVFIVGGLDLTDLVLKKLNKK